MQEKKMVASVAAIPVRFPAGKAAQASAGSPKWSEDDLVRRFWSKVNPSSLDANPPHASGWFVFIMESIKTAHNALTSLKATINLALKTRITDE